MAKDLPYFKFFSSEWNDGDITLEDFDTQGLFINLCSYYWSHECLLSLEKAKKRFRNCPEKCFDSLINSKIIKIINGDVRINFLDEQKEDRIQKALINKENGAKGGRPKNPIETEENPVGLDSLTEDEAKQKALREEKKREEEIRKEKEASLEKKETIDWDGLISFFNLTFGKSSRIISKEVKAKYNARLKETFTKEDILNAMVNASKDSFHRDNNYKYCTLEFFSRSDKLEKYSSISNGSLQPKRIEPPKITKEVARGAMNVPAYMEDLIRRGATRELIEGISNGTLAPTGSDY